METKIIHITSGKGPAECCLAAALALKELIREAKAAGLSHEVIARCPGPENGTIASATLKLQGKAAAAFAEGWEGSLLWIAQSPYRRYHKRKNWFIGVSLYDPEWLPAWKEQDVQVQTMRSSGPGGQNVNKVESAVRAIHQPSGLQVTVRESRSQLQNKKLAMERLKQAFLDWQIVSLQQAEERQWLDHHSLQRGNPVRTYCGTKFEKQRKP